MKAIQNFNIWEWNFSPQAYKLIQIQILYLDQLLQVKKNDFWMEIKRLNFK